MSQETGQPAPELTLREFAKTLYHNKRYNNYFKFLKDFPEEKLDLFFQELLKQVGHTIDTGDTSQLTRLVQHTQVEGYKPTEQVQAKRSQTAPQAVPLATLSKPLNQSNIALFTTAAIRKSNQPNWYPAEQTYDEAVKDVMSSFERFATWRIIEKDTPVSDLEVTHVAFDITAAQQDVNVIFPLERFRELEKAGFIGKLADLNYSMQGLTNLQRLEQEIAPQWAQEIKAAGVDAVFLTPG